MSFELENFVFFDAIKHWALVVGALVGIAVLLSMMTAALGGGQLGFVRALGSILRGKRKESLPWGEVKEAYVRVFRGIRDGIVEMVGMSPRRVWALAILTFKESTRRKALLVFGLPGEP